MHQDKVRTEYCAIEDEFVSTMLVSLKDHDMHKS